ncbi:RNA recognition motif domain-containing protein [Methanofollis fontis]|uniref:RNA-binding protein n=1 Tax=Methanofollis fontis TaxID=2052832 RepID=A0A483CQP2_9EURY|nr:RNA-binding protein [Methanofollis fontis]TAJ45433.1 RNA-binding protein [Methanofollis fontis]
MQTSRLYVGNLNYATTEEQLGELFASYGDVTSVRVLERKGFGFVEFATVEEAEKAMAALNETEFMGRTLRIDEARPPKPRTEFRRY